MSQAAAPSPSDPGAWLARYEELRSSLFAALARPLGLDGPGGRETFDDLFQIAITAAWVRERGGEPIRNPRAFLRQVIVNQRKMQLRSERRHPASSFDELAATVERTGAGAVEAIADRRPSISEQVEQRELTELVMSILATIERRASTVWTLRYVCGWPPERVTGALGITQRQYARLLERATTVIDRKLAAYVAGDWCAGHAPKLVRLAAGRAGAAEAQQARAHLAACPSCRDSYATFTRLHHPVTSNGSRGRQRERVGVDDDQAHGVRPACAQPTQRA